MITSPSAVEVASSDFLQFRLGLAPAGGVTCALPNCFLVQGKLCRAPKEMIYPMLPDPCFEFPFLKPRSDFRLVLGPWRSTITNLVTANKPLLKYIPVT